MLHSYFPNLAVQHNLLEYLLKSKINVWVWHVYDAFWCGRRCMAGFTNFMTSTYYSYAVYTSTKSTRIHCLFNEHLEHISGEVPKNAFDKIKEFSKDLLNESKIPSVDIECGRLGIPGATETQQIVQGMISLLIHLDMLSSNSKPNSVTPKIFTKRSSVKV